MEEIGEEVVEAGGGREEIEVQNKRARRVTRRDKRVELLGDLGRRGLREKMSFGYPRRSVQSYLGIAGQGIMGCKFPPLLTLFSQPDGAKTIEGEFFAALVKAGAVSSDNADDHRKVDVQRAARTDAGVHAAGNVISMKMILEPPIPEGFKDLADYVNSFLPPTIRMWGFVRTVKSFQARLTCDSRKYEYVFPSYCLLPPSRTDPLALQLDASSPGWRDTLGAAAEFADAAEPTVKSGEGGEGEGDVDVDPKARGEYERRRGWRIDPGTMGRFRDLVKEYLGTHNFHNYTVGKPFNDRTVKRYMIEINVRDPQVVGEIEWVSVSIHGQSFMLHQIRKMMSLAMLACRTGSPPALIPETYGPKRIHVPKAPPLGLLLEAPQFSVYNMRVSEKTNGLEADREPVDFGLYQAQIDEFKLKHIYDQLRADELQSHVFHKWIRQMDCAIGPTLSFLNTHGIIPPEAQLSINKSKGDNKDAAADGAVDNALQNEIQSEDEEVDQELLKRGELEG
ncbi:pseudouridine synthase [Naematelia encephala]|uniref:tRNA pseudouridine synthase 1 n=1 Tax=Naematelia encephala TaxID=71784 RepID=A0A1Y2AQ09_9TREE|nr:pseudouridine synthase [Naematelia encephala]